ncbi:MAG: hypothetical protein QNL62_20255, partial [Gammaproteobacteria bacterium]|nr:hypothetical protein [Gammaproteobacteria bacterium]
MNHLRLHNTVLPDLRQWEPLERLNTAFNSIPHTANVRRVATDNGDFNIANINIFLWRLDDYPLTQIPAFQIDNSRFMFSSLGNNTPLFTFSKSEDNIRHIAKPVNVPEPISRRVLDTYMEQYYGIENSLLLRNGTGDEAEIIESSQIVACNLSDIEQQRIQITGHTDGQYSLSFEGEATDALDHDATVETIQTALEGLTAISADDITVTGTVTETEIDLLVTFNNADADSPEPLISIDSAALNSVAEITTSVLKNWAHSPLSNFAIDPVLGRIALPSNKPQRIQISGHDGGQYTLQFNGNESVVNHNASIAELRTAFSILSNLSEDEVFIKGRVSETEVDFVVSFSGVLSAQDVADISVVTAELTPEGIAAVTELIWAGTVSDDLNADFYYGFSADMGGGEYERRTTFYADLEIIAELSDGDLIQDSLDAASASGAIQINSSGRFEQTFAIDLAASRRLELRAGNGHRPTLVFNNDLLLTAEEDGEVILNGLLITGGSIVIPALNNSISKVTLKHCTLVPGLTLDIDGIPLQSETPSLIVEMDNITVVLDHCIIGGIRSDRGATFEINDSIIDAMASSSLAFGALPDNGLLAENNDDPGGILEIINSTVIGRVFASAIPLASNVIFFSQALDEGSAPVRALNKQTGCMRFCYVPPDSIVPRRYRCQPDLAVKTALVEANKIMPVSQQQTQNITHAIHAGMRPGFTDLRYGHPAYCQLRHSTPIEIKTGADDESEMGVFHQLYQPQRETNLRIRLDEYLRFGLEAGFFYAN